MSYIESLQEKIRTIICDVKHKQLSYDAMIIQLIKVFIKIKENHHMLYFVGNGGSAGVAIHMTSDYLKNGGICTHSMHDAATITCLGNDFGYEHIFSKQLELVANSGDVLVAVSSSGNSQNILNAVETAKEKECSIITLSGFKKDNRLRYMGDYNIYVPSMSYGMVESIHNIILQQVVDEIMVKEEL
jgi:D-sedoheptulose 7-phosphate isomerase